MKQQFFFHHTTAKNARKALAILFVGLVLTSTVSYYTTSNVELQAKQEFSLVCNEIKMVILTRLHVNAQLLQIASSFFAASDTVTRNEWKKFIKQAKLDINLPGIQGVGFSLIIPKNQLQQHIQKIRNEGFDDYTVKPTYDREIYTSIVFLEPFTERNQRAFGFDMFSEPIRRRAMELSRDSDLAILSGKVILVQETNKDLQAGTLMYVPVYRNGVPSKSLQERRSAIKGWVYSPYRMSDLMHGVLGRWDIKTQKRIHLQIYDDDIISNNSIMFDSQGNDSTTKNYSTEQVLTIPIDFNGKRWTLQFSKSEEKHSFFQGMVIIVIISGITISFLLFFLSLALFNTRYRAQYIASNLTSELKESEARFKNMFKLHNAVMLLIEPESGQILDANQSASDFYGYSIHELISMSINDINTLKPEETAAVRKQIVENKQNHFIFIHRLANGQMRTVDVYSSSIIFENRKIIFAIMHDITERKQAQDSLAYERQRLSSILKGTNAGTWEWNIQTGETVFNEKWADFIGYTIEELYPISIETWIKYTHPDDLKISGELLEKHFRGELDYYQFEARMKHKNGHWIWVLDRGRVHKWDKEGKPLLMSGTHQDITDRKLAEESLRENNSRLNLAMQVANMAWWEMDILTGNINFDKRKAEMLDFPPDKFKHYKDFMELVNPLDYEKVMDAMEKHFSGILDRYEVEYRIKTKSGDYIWFYDIGTIGKRDQTEKPLNITGLVIDITNRKQAELLLIEQNEEIRTKNEEYIQVNEELRQSNEELFITRTELEKSNQKFRTVADYTYNWEYWQGLDNQIIYISPSCERISGYRPDEFMADKLLLEKIIYHEDVKLFEDHLQFDHFTENINDIHEIEYRIVKKDGNIIHIIHVCRSVFDALENYIGRRVSIREITLRKQAEAALKESSQKWRAIVSASPDGIGMVSFDGRIQLMSNKLATMYGYSVEQIDELLGKSIFDFIDPSNHQLLIDNINKLKLGLKEHKITEYLAIKQDNCRFYVDVNSTILLDSKGNPSSILFVERDITERKRAEEALHWSQSLLQLMSSSSPLGFLVVDKRTDDILYFNQRFCEIWGIVQLSEKMKLGEMKNNDIIPYCLPVLADIQAFAESCKPLQDEENRVVIEDEISFTEGRTVRRFSTQIRGENDEYFGRFYIFEDITERKQANDLIQQTRQNYEAFFNTIDDFLFVLDTQGNIIHTNTTVLKRLDYRAEELNGQSVLMIHPPERREEAGWIVSQMLEGKADYCPVPIVTKSGKQISVETRVSKGFWNGQPVIFGVTKDISQIKLSEEKFSKAFHSNGALMALSYFEEGGFIDVNETFLKTLNYSKVEVIGKSAKDLNLFVKIDTRNNFINSLKNKDSQKGIEVQVRTKDGQIKSGIFSAEKIYIGHELCLLTTMVDITNIKQAEQIIEQQNAELVKLNSDKDRFITILAHDLKSPFNSILGFLGLLSKNVRKYDIDEIEKLINIVNNSAQTTYKLLEDILIWVRAQSGKIPFVPQKLNLASICVDSLQDMKVIADSKKITINYVSTGEQFIFADERMTKTVLRNLISNAIKFTNPEGGIEIRVDQNQNFMIISVTDNGIGIEPEILSKLFDITQVVSTNGTANEKGTGLGLLLCKEFIEKHGGKIWVESELGIGSSFIFTLPK